FGRMLGSGINSRNNGCYPPNPDAQINSRLPQKFTGKERDAETRLDYFGARYFSAAQGRFMSPDPLGGRLEDPQTLNRYSYVRNAPLILTDPTGLDFNLDCKDEGDTCHKGLVGKYAADGR